PLGARPLGARSTLAAPALSGPDAPTHHAFPGPFQPLARGPRLRRGLRSCVLAAVGFEPTCCRDPSCPGRRSTGATIMVRSDSGYEDVLALYVCRALLATDAVRKYLRADALRRTPLDAAGLAELKSTTVTPERARRKLAKRRDKLVKKG